MAFPRNPSGQSRPAGRRVRRSIASTSYILAVALSAACSGEVTTNGTPIEGMQPPGAGTPLGPNGSIAELPTPAPGASVVNVDGCNSQTPPLSAQLRRLSEPQIKNSITDIFGNIFPDTIWARFEDGARLIGMNTLADKLQVNSINLERHYDATKTVVQRILEQNSEFQNCVRARQSACVDDLIETYGQRVWRRPLTQGERQRFTEALAAYDDNEAKLAFAFNALLVSSEFLFRSENGSSVPGLAGMRLLNNYEVVSFLAYAIWNSTPDDALLDTAKQAAPLSADQLAREVDRMLADTRATDALVELYKDYLKLELILKRDKDDDLGLTPEARTELLASVEQGLAARISPAPDLMSVFGGNAYFVNTATAPFFDEQAAQDVGPEFSLVSTDPSQRDGVLNHPAFLSVHSTRSSSGIVQRGVFTLEQLLCQHLPDPPADISSDGPPPGLDPERTSERELLSATHSSKAECVGCHQFIDPAGFGFENFDAAGRYRTTEKLDVPIDASGELDGVGAYATSADFSRALVGSERMKLCVTQRFLEHYMGQGLSANSCAVLRYRALVSQEQDSVHGLLRALVQLPSFTSRTQLEVSQ